MIFKEGCGWKCCYDPETGLYTAQIGGVMDKDLYEINKEIFDQVDDPSIEWPTRLICQGRHLFMSVDDGTLLGGCAVMLFEPARSPDSFSKVTT